MRLTHPPPKICSPPQFWPIPPTRLRHPIPEIIRAYPARVKLREDGQERAHFVLFLGGGVRGVGGCEGVEEGPG